MTFELGALTFDASDPQRLATFWAGLFDTTWRPGRDLPEAAVVEPAPGRPALLFLAVPESKTAKNRCHPDLHTGDVDDAVGKALRLGARWVDEHHRPGRWVVLADVEGNEFCIVEDENVGQAD